MAGVKFWRIGLLKEKWDTIPNLFLLSMVAPSSLIEYYSDSFLDMRINFF